MNTEQNIKTIVANGGSSMNIPLPHRATFAPAISSGLKLCKVNGRKNPDAPGWNLPGNEITDIAALPEYTNAGILLAPSNRATIDLDDLFMAQMLFAERGLNLQDFLDAPDSVQIISGRPGSGKLFYAMPEGLTLPSKNLKVNLKTILEFRNSTAEGKSVQDVCPGSKHPGGTVYAWGGRGEWTNPPPLPDAILAWWQELLAPRDHVPSGATTLEDLEEVKSALSKIPASVDHDTWLKVLMALHSTGHADACDLARTWSQTCAEKWCGDRTFDKRWASFNAEKKANPVTIASLFAVAREYGWIKPPVDHSAMFNGLPPPAAVDTAPAASGWNFKPCDVRHMMSTPAPPIPWLFDHRWQSGRGYLLTGIGGSSKTRMMYMQAIAAITGVCAWGWSVVKTGKAVLILTEDTEEEAHLTLESTINVMGLTDTQREMVAENITIFALAGENVKLLEMRGTVLHESETLHGLEKMIMELGDVVFIGLDPALGLTEGDENSQNHQRTLGRCADNLAVRTGAAVAVISHATKASNNADELNSHNSRGGGSITDAMRGEYSMRTMTAKEAQKAGVTDITERKRLVQLVATKGNHLPPEAFVPIWFRRVEGGALTVAEISMDKPAGTVSKSHRKVYDVLVSEYAKTNEPVKLSDLKERCIFESAIQCPTPEAITKSLTRAMKALCDAGMATTPSRGKYLPVWIGDEDED